MHHQYYNSQWNREQGQYTGHYNKNLQDTLCIQFGIRRCNNQESKRLELILDYHNTTQQGIWCMIDVLLVNNSLTDKERSDLKKLKHKHIPQDRVCKLPDFLS